MERKINRKAASKWTQCSERALLEIWREKMSELRGCRKNSHILQEMVYELEAQGYKYTILELKTKMHNATARYRKEKQKIGTTGGSPSDWDLFNEVQVLLAPFKSYHSESLVVDNICHINSSIKTCSISPPSSSPMPAASSPMPTASSPSSPILADSSPSSPMPAASSPSSPMPAASLSSSPCMPSTSTAAKKRNETIEKCFKNLEKNMEKIHDDIKRTSHKALAIEEEKKEILKAYVEREAKLQEALLEFLKRD